MAIRRRLGTIRAAVMIVVVLVATIACTSHDAHAQVPSPTVISVSPNRGPAAGGTVVAITGTNFTDATAVKFGSTNAASFTVTSARSIVATSPAGTGIVDVTVTNDEDGVSPISALDRFTFEMASTVTALSSSPNPSIAGQSVTLTAVVTGVSPTGTMTFFDGGNQIGSATVAAGMATFTTSSLAAGSHSITAKYGGDPNNVVSTSALLTQTVGAPTDSIKLRAMQVTVTPMIAQISGQAIAGAISSAIDVGFNPNPQGLVPNGGGFSFHVPLDQPASGNVGTGVGGASGPGTRSLVHRRPDGGAKPEVGSLANGRHGGNGALPGTRLIDLPVIPLPPGSGMPPVGETRFSPDEVMFQFASAATPQQIADISQRFGLALSAQQTIGLLGRTIYTFRIVNGRSVREVIGLVEATGLKVAVQPIYDYALTQDQNAPLSNPSDPAQYILKRLRLTEAHQISKGDNVVIAVIDSEIDSSQPDLAGRVTDRFDAGCGASSPDPHGTGMAGAIASHVRLLGVAPNAKIIAICAFGGTGQPNAPSLRIVKGLDYAIQRGARIVNMSFAGPRDPTLSQALQIAREKGILVIAAAGNNGPKSPPLYPGADRNVMAITATDANDRLFIGANQGKYISLAAPGVDILVPAPNGGQQFTTGTSVATANVSGVAALLLAHKPSLTPEEIRAILVTTARPLGSSGVNSQFGAGLVDPLKALQWVVSQKPASELDNIRRALASIDTSDKRVDDGFQALGYAAGQQWASKTQQPVAPPHKWLAWIDVRGTDFSRNTFGSDLRGMQLNALAGLTHRLAPDFLVGVLAGYEHFDYTSQAFNGALRGDGWTAGAYLGWRFAPNLRLDAGAAWSDIRINDVAGTAAATLTGRRLLTTGGVTGTYGWQSFVLEPSARVYALWEHENGYTDSLGTLQSDRNFVTGRTSGGVQVSYPFAWSSTVNLAPYAGLYSDYYFSRDDALAPGLSAAPLLAGWSARATAGVAATFSGGAQLSAGGEFGGIGGNTNIWTWRFRGRVPF